MGRRRTLIMVFRMNLGSNSRTTTSCCCVSLSAVEAFSMYAPSSFSTAGTTLAMANALVEDVGRHSCCLSRLGSARRKRGFGRRERRSYLRSLKPLPRVSHDRHLRAGPMLPVSEVLRMVELSKSDFSLLCRGPTPTPRAPRAPHTDPTRTPCAPLIGHAPGSTLAWSNQVLGQSAVFRPLETLRTHRSGNLAAAVKTLAKPKFGSLSRGCLPASRAPHRLSSRTTLLVPGCLCRLLP
jgi:hypothetical protein